MLRALIVQNNPGLMNSIIRALDTPGSFGPISVERMADSGVIAIEAVRNAPIDIILLGTDLPDMSGYDVLQTIRERIGRDNNVHTLPILMVTTDARAESKRRAFELGANDYICAPFDHAELVARMWAHHSARQTK